MKFWGIYTDMPSLFLAFGVWQVKSGIANSTWEQGMFDAMRCV